MVNSDTALYAYGDVENVQSSDLKDAAKKIVAVTVPYVETAAAQEVTIADWAKYENKDSSTSSALSNVEGLTDDDATTLAEAYEILEAGTGAAATLPVSGEVDESTFGENAEIIAEENGLYIVKTVAEDKTIGYYVIEVTSTIVDLMSRDDIDTVLAEITYTPWEFGEEKTAEGLDEWLTKATEFVVDYETNTITFTGNAKAIDPTDFSYKNSEIGTNTDDFIPLYGYKDYAYYCVVGKYEGDALVGKGGKNAEGTDNVEGYFEAVPEKVAAFGDKFAIIAISETAEGSEDTSSIIIGNKQDSVKLTINDVEWTIILDLDWGTPA